jgi:hypothetical protein
MQDINPLSVVSRGLDEMALMLAPRADPRTFPTADEGKHAYIRREVSYYVYAVIAHIRTVLHGLIALADSGNISTVTVVARHLFEWVAHVCYMTENLQTHIVAKDWDAARDLLDQAVIGNRWIKEHGHKYDPTQDATTIPKTIRLNKILASYEAHIEKVFGGDAKDDYAYLSEHSHPSSACLYQYVYREPGGQVRFAEPKRASLQVVNSCVIDFTNLLLELLKLSDDRVVRPKLGAILKEILDRHRQK